MKKEKELELELEIGTLLKDTDIHLDQNEGIIIIISKTEDYFDDAVFKLYSITQMKIFTHCYEIMKKFYIPL